MNEKCDSYVYFALYGEVFDPKEITKRLGIEPTESCKKGDKGKYKPILDYSCWQISTEIGKEYFNIDKLVDEVIEKLENKIQIINNLKDEYNLDSVLEIVMYIDTNSNISTPSLGYDLKTIDFLYKTQTKTDIDIYKFQSF